MYGTRWPRCTIIRLISLLLNWGSTVDDITGRGLHLSHRKPGKAAEETLRLASNHHFICRASQPPPHATHTCVRAGVKNVLPITTAKVPIVKFYHVQTGLEGDISLYNTLVELLLYF